MNFEVIKDKFKLEGTAYFEFLPRKFNNKHWNDSPIYLDEQSMCIVEGVFEKFIKGYDHYSFSEITKEEYKLVINGLKDLIKNIEENNDITGIIFNEEYYIILNSNIKNNKDIVIRFIRDLINWIEETMSKVNRISILGI